MALQGFIDVLDGADRQAMLVLNFNGGSFADVLAEVFSSRLVWVPWALFLIYYLMFVRKRSRWQVLAVIVGLVVVVTLCDQVSSSLLKPLVGRLRPSHDDGISEALHYVGGYRGGLYGFVSSHAANAFGAAAFSSLLLRKRMFTVSIFVFSILVSYSRIYLGVHYLGDVLGGCLLGVYVGFGTYWCYKMLVRDSSFFKRIQFAR